MWFGKLELVEEETWTSFDRFKYFRQIWSRFSGKVDLPTHFTVYSTLQNMLEWNWHISFTSS